MSITLNPILGSSFYVVLLGLFFFWLLVRFCLRRTDRSALARGLFVLRLLLLLLVLFMMLRPSFVRTMRRPLNASLFFVLDTSESMNVQDEAGEISRYDRLRQTIQKELAPLHRLADNFDLRFFSLDTDLRPILKNGDWELPERATGSTTELGSGLLSLLQECRGRRVPAVVLLSDGTQRSRSERILSPEEVAFRFRDAGIPIEAIPFGKTDRLVSVQDIAVRRLLANDRCYRGNEFVITGQVRVMGFQGQSIPIQLHFEQESGRLEQVAEQIVIPKTNEEEVFPFRFVYIPQKAGEWKFSVSSPLLPKEIVATNNELGAFVRVQDGGLRLLYLEGTRRFEQKYLRLALDSAAEISVDYRRPIPDTMTRPVGKTEAECLAFATGSRPSLVADCFAPDKYAAYILGNIDASALKKEEIDALVERVQQGAGLILLASGRSLACGGFAKTSLAALVPIEMDPNQRVPLELDPENFEQSLPKEQRTRQSGAWKIDLTEQGKSWFPLQLESTSDRSRAIWNSLPALETVYRVGRPKPTARVPAIVRSESSGGTAFPFLISHQYGLGRVTIVATDSTWNWFLSGYESWHKKFWRQLILWSARRDELPEGELVLELDRSRFSSGETVAFRLLYRTKGDEKAEQLSFQVSSIDPVGEIVNLELSEENGQYLGAFPCPELPGDYRLQATVSDRSSGKEIRRTQTRFLCYKPNPELDEPGASPQVLENLAMITSGQTTSPEKFDSLLERLSKKREDLNELRKETVTLYDNWLVFSIFIFIISLEWGIRKRKGLV